VKWRQWLNKKWNIADLRKKLFFGLCDYFPFKNIFRLTRLFFIIYTICSWWLFSSRGALRFTNDG